MTTTEPARPAPPPLMPETLMMGHGYRPEWSEGSLKPPIFQSSTFVFRTAAEGRAFFEVAPATWCCTASRSTGAPTT